MVGKRKNGLCKDCKKVKIQTDISKSGLCSRCLTKKWQKENPKLFTKILERYYDENHQYFLDSSRKHYENNKEKRLEQSLVYVKKRYKEDEAFRNRHRLGSALSKVIRIYIKTGKIRNPMRKYCIDWKGIIKKLSPIPKDRQNYHVDHIVPLYKFDLANWEQIQIAFAPENHRWLKVKENLKRSKLRRTSHLNK